MIGRSRMPMARSRRVTAAPYEVSRSRMRSRGASSHGNASVIWSFEDLLMAERYRFFDFKHEA